MFIQLCDKTMILSSIFGTYCNYICSTVTATHTHTHTHEIGNKKVNFAEQFLAIELNC